MNEELMILEQAPDLREGELSRLGDSQQRDCLTATGSPDEWLISKVVGGVTRRPGSRALQAVVVSESVPETTDNECVGLRHTSEPHERVPKRVV